MRAFIITLSAILVMALAFWAYRENYRTQNELADLRALQNEVGELRESLGVLKAEWAYLNRPDRLRALVDANAATLALVELAPDQFADVGMVDFPPPPDPAVPDTDANIEPASAGAKK